MTTDYTGNDTGNAGTESAADAVRRAFAALPFEQRLTTLLRIEVDLVGDVANTVVSTASRAVDEFVSAFKNAARSQEQTATDDRGV